ncbi:MAG: hypothetical protein ACRELY_21335 [Polyangiaceae bacterium]
MKPTTSKTGLIAKIRQRLGRRGVAMVEGAIVFPLMGGMLVMLELGHHSYDAYLTVGHVGQERTWSSATAGSLIGSCPKTLRDDTSYADQVASSGKYFTLAGDAAVGDDNSSKGSTPPTGSVPVPSTQMSWATNGLWSHTDGATATVKVARGGRSFTNNPASKDKVYCNQKWYGTLVDIISNAI